MRRALPAATLLLLAACKRDAPPPTGGPASANAASQVLFDRDVELGGGSAPDITVPVAMNDELVVTVTSTSFDPVLEVIMPSGDALHNDDYQGSRQRSQLTVHATQAGALRLNVSSFMPGSAGRYHVRVQKVPTTATAPLFLGLGATVQGEVSAGDRALPDGRTYDELTVLGPPPGTAYELRLTARGQVIPLAVVMDPAGRAIASTGAGVYPLRDPFMHRVQIIAPAVGQSAGYTVALVTAQAAAAGQPQAAIVRDHHSIPAEVAGRAIAVGNVEGTLSSASTRLPSGESADVYQLDVTANQAVSVDAQSDAFDTYLVAVGPDGRLQENDDANGTTNAHLDLQFPVAGRVRLFVTSYRAGTGGRYVLKIGTGTSASEVVAATQDGSPAAALTGDSVDGELRQGDRTLRSGEFVDTYRRSFTVGQPVQFRLSSRDFDPYLIVRTPGGQQQDNDDFAPPDRSAGIDIPAAEAGEYAISVTTYQAGERGRYRLTIGSENGAVVAQNPSTAPSNPSDGVVPATRPAVPGEGRLFGIFVGITDYPEGVGDLDECANDAIKLAEALRNRGLLAADRQIVLTDARATRDAVRAAFRQAASQIGPNDTFIFFHSGHGSQTEGSRDAREIDGRDEAIYLYDGQLLDDEMGTLFDLLHPETAILALDSCFAGGFAKDVITRPGRVGFFSSEEDVESSVASQFQAGGYLSYFLRTGVTGEADNGPRDNALTVGELEHFLVVQFGRHATDVELAGAYQHLVVDRGAVRSTEVLWRYH